MVCKGGLNVKYFLKSFSIIGLFLLLILLTNSCGSGGGKGKTGTTGNTWAKTFGGIYGDWGNSVQQTSDGGYILVGQTYSIVDGNKVYLIKTDSFGNTVWGKSFGEPGSDAIGTSVQQTSDGGYIVVGSILSNCYLIKTDSLGNTLWEKTFQESDYAAGTAVQQTSDGGYILTGYATHIIPGYASYNDIFLIKTDANGNTTWNTIYGGTGSDWGFSVQQTSDGGYIIVGQTDSFGAGKTDAYLIKTDSQGAVIWEKTFGGGDMEWRFSGQQTSDGGYIIAGTTDFDSGDDNILLIKTDLYGNPIWQRTFDGKEGKRVNANSVCQTIDGGYIIVGSTGYPGSGMNPTHDDVLLIKTDSKGAAIWEKTFGGTESDIGESVQQTSDGGHIVVGYTYSFGAGNYDIYLLKTDSKGNIQ
jgi:hypothetical protein